MDENGSGGGRPSGDPQGADGELHALVRQTEGLQPWRRLFHATSGVVVAVALTQLPLSRAAAVAILGGGTLLLFAADLLRLLYPPANALFFRAFRLLASPREAGGVASSTWHGLGMTLAVLLFSREHAVSGILVMALADPAGSYIGRRWGRRPFLGGTVLGSSAFAAVALAVLMLRHAPAVAAAGAFAAMLAERRSWPLDDNLAVPVVAAAVTVWVTALL